MVKKINKLTPQLELDFKNSRAGGVVSGIAKYYKKDPILLRIIAIAFIIITGIIPGIIVYVAFYSLMRNNEDKK